MKNTEIIEALRQKLTVPGGRHLYGVLGTYKQLEAFAKKLRQAKTLDAKRFPKPLNVNRGILDAIPDDEFRQLAENEAKRPEPTAAHVAKAFERFLRAKLRGKGLVVLSNAARAWWFSPTWRCSSPTISSLIYSGPWRRTKTACCCFCPAGAQAAESSCFTKWTRAIIRCPQTLSQRIISGNSGEVRRKDACCWRA